MKSESTLHCLKTLSAGLIAACAVLSASAEKVLYFNGSTYIDMGTGFPLGDNVSLSAWVRVDPQFPSASPANSGAGVVGQGYWGNARGLGLFASGAANDGNTSNDGMSFQVRVHKSDSPSGNPSAAEGTFASGAYKRTTLFTGGEWHHYLIVRDKGDGTAQSGTVSFYVDGVLITNMWFRGDKSISPTTFNFAIGKSMSNVGGNFCGWVADVALWNSALTAADASKLPFLGPQKVSTAPYAYFPLNEGSGTYVSNVVANVGYAKTAGTLTWQEDASFVRSQNFVVAGEPVACGIPSPSYGNHDDIGAGDSVDVSCPAVYTNYPTATIWHCTGWTLYDVDGTVISSGAGNSFAYTHPNPAAYRRLEWQWEASAYCGTTAAGHGGTVSPSGAEWYAVDTPVTVTATPNAGSSFKRWNGTLPAGIDATSPSVTFTPTAPFDMTALFVSGDPFTWTGEGDTAAWSDGGNWEGGTAPGSGDTAIIPEGITAKWSQTDKSFMNALAGIELNGDMEVSNMTAATTLTVPLWGSGVFRGLYGAESAPSLSSGTYYYLTLQNDNRGFTGTFAFTNCGVCVNHNLALGSASTRCTLRWRNGTGGNNRRLYFQSPGPHNANMFLSQPNYSHGMIFAVCDNPTYLDGDIDLTGEAQFNANNRANGLHIRGKLTNSGKKAYNLNPYVYLEGEVNLQYNSQSQFGGGFYLGGGNGNVKNMGHLYLDGNGIHFAAPNVLSGGNADLCYWIVGNGTALKLYLDGNDQNWYRQPSAQGFIVNSTSPATLRMMNFGSANQTFNTANCLTGYASFDVCATNKSGSKYTTTVTTTHCTTGGGLLCGAGTFVVGNSAAESITTSFSNLTSLVTYNAGTMKIYNTDVNPVNGITNLSVLGTSAMTLGDGVSFNAVQANLSSAASLTIPAGSTIRVSDHTYLDGEALRRGVYGKVGGTYADGSGIPKKYQLSCLTGDGWLETEGPGPLGLILVFR